MDNGMIPQGPRHGTSDRYDLGCRCERCTKAIPVERRDGGGGS